MKAVTVGDLVIFKPNVSYGNITSTKWFIRMHRKCGGIPGIIIKDHGESVVVFFGDNKVVLNKEYLEKIHESG